MKLKIINYLALFLDNNIPEKYLSKFQEFLLSGAIFTEASTVLAILIIFILAIITVIHDYKHGTMPFQKQREFLREQGLSLRKSSLKRNTQNKPAADPHAGMKRVKKRNTDEK